MVFGDDFGNFLRHELLPPGITILQQVEHLVGVDFHVCGVGVFECDDVVVIEQVLVEGLGAG